MSRVVILLATCAILPWFVFGGTTDSVPRLVNFSAALKDGTGKPVTGTQALTFSLYSDQDSRTPLWQEKQNVQADETGHYTVQLGAATASGMPLELFQAGTPLWLGVQPQSGDPEQPRVLLVSVPYALKAADADTLGGKPLSAFVTREAGAAAGGEATAVANTRDAAALSSGIAGAGTANYIPLWTDSATLGNSLFYQTGNNIGLGTITPAGGLHLIPPSSSTKGLIVEGAASQTANLQEWQNNSGTALASINSAGGAFFPSAGIGSTGPQPGTALNVRQSFSSTSGAVAGVTTVAQLTPTAASSANLYGQSTTTTVSGTVGTSGQVYGDFLEAMSSVTAGGTVGSLFGARYVGSNSGTGAVNNLYGGYFGAYNQGGGTVSNQYGGYFLNIVQANSKVTNVFGDYIAAPAISGGGAASNIYGLFLQNMTGATGSNYSIYSAGGTNFFSGNVGIGTAAPAAKLEVNGTAKFDGLITFAKGQTFPGGGGGTITGVTAGTDLTGGGTSGNVTLNLDTTKVPELAAGNTYTNWQTISAPAQATALTAYGGGTGGGSYGGDGVFASGGSGVNQGRGGSGVYAEGGNSDTSDGGHGIDAFGGNGGTSGGGGYGIYAQGGEDNNGVQNYAGSFFGGVSIDSANGINQPQLLVFQDNADDYARLRFGVNGITTTWDIAVSGGSLPVMNFYRSGSGNVMSLTPGDMNLLTMLNGAYLSAGGDWTSTSDRNLKTDFQHVSGADVLRRLSAVPITTWSDRAEE